jgi:hypothetical protein
MHAFERAGRAREAKIAKTYSLRDAARSTPFSKESMSGKRNAFSSAAESFWDCAEEAKGKERRVFFHNAADCFEEAEDYRRAAQAYENAKEYAPAVRLYRKAEMFDEAVQIIQIHRQEVGEELASNVLEVARLFYFKNKEFR